MGPTLRTTPAPALGLGRIFVLARVLVLLSPLAALVAACSPSPAESNAKYPSQKEGCNVEVYPEIPLGQTENIGPVSATCDESVSDADCLRTLKDQACKLGANVVWGVGDPEMRNGKKKLSGRAAHTKTPPR